MERIGMDVQDGARGAALGLAGLSGALGIAGLTAPARLSVLTGTRYPPGVFVAFGLRELASGVLTRGRPRAGLWSRVVGDVMDVALVLGARRRGDRRRIRATLAMLAVVGVLDVLAVRRAERERASSFSPA